MTGPAPTTNGANDWPVLSRLLDAALLLPPERRSAWIDGLEGDDARLKALLRELLAKDGEELPPIPALAGQVGADGPADGDVTQSRASTGRAMPGQAMVELGNALGRFVGGLSDVDELRGTFRDFLRLQPEQREATSRWLREGIQTGRLAPAILLTIGDLIEPPVNDASPTPPGSAAAAAAPRVPVAPGPGGRNDADATGVRVPAAVDAAEMATEGALREGCVLDGRYTLVAQLGHGGMGTVFKARDRNREDFHDRHPYIALKVLSEEFKRNPDARMALQRETTRAQSLAHPNVITVYDFDYDGPHAYMTMELLEGQTLEDWLQAEATYAPFGRRWFIVRSIGAGLAYAHEKGVVHSDLKPGNVFLCKGGAVKVMDFGIARPLRIVTEQSEATLFDAGERLGALTPAYASLEQWDHEAPDPRDDIYAFACVVYFIFSGKHPFASASAKKAFDSELVPQRIESLTRRQWDALRRGLAFQRADRIASVDEFLRQFAPRTWLQKNRLWIAGIAALIGTAVLVAAAILFRGYGEERFIRLQSRPRAVAPTTPLTPEQRRDIADSLYLAQDTLQQAGNTKSVEDLSYFLSEGANNANQMLDSVLALDPANQQALKLKAAAAQVYESNARSLIAGGKLADALKLVGYGLKVQPDSRELFRLKEEICNRDAAVCTGE